METNSMKVCQMVILLLTFFETHLGDFDRTTAI